MILRLDIKRGKGQRGRWPWSSSSCDIYTKPSLLRWDQMLVGGDSGGTLWDVGEVSRARQPQGRLSFWGSCPPCCGLNSGGAGTLGR